jgi:putative glycosyltransferase (TIGR04372 family)
MSSSSKFLIFTLRQISQLKYGEKELWMRKIKFLLLFFLKLPLQLIFFFPAILFVLISRLLQPIFLVRFEKFLSNRIGHFAGNIEQYLCELDAEINKPKKNFIDFWYHPCPPCNAQLSRMWGRVLNVAPRHMFVLVEIINNFIPGGDLHKIGHNTNNDRDTNNLLEKFPPHLSFLNEEARLGMIGLKSLGIPDGKPFICLAVRDSAYLHNQSPHLDWTRHNYRDGDIQNYILAADKLTQKGYYVVRMGAIVNQSMKTDNPFIIDYATNGTRSDFMDIYLGAKCTFCISNTMGFDAVPVIFRRPVLYIDNPQLGTIRTENSNSISTIKKYWKQDQNRLLTFKEIFEAGFDALWFSQEYEENGIKLIESNPVEIAAVALEMEGRLSGKWQSTKDDERLQNLFWEIFPQSDYHGEIKSRIGAEFLSQNQDLLE